MTALITFLWFLSVQPQMPEKEPLVCPTDMDQTAVLIVRKYQTVLQTAAKLETQEMPMSCALISVVMPEYLSFSPMTGAAELMYMSAAFRADKSRFGRTSFGPFQMQPDFIVSQLVQSSRYSDTELFRSTRLFGNDWVAEHLEEFSQMEVQLRILLMFEENFRRRYPGGSYEEMASLYNSGSVRPSPRVFSKLHQADWSYLEWVRYIRSVVGC